MSNQQSRIQPFLDVCLTIKKQSQFDLFILKFFNLPFQNDLVTQEVIL